MHVFALHFLKFQNLLPYFRGFQRVEGGLGVKLRSSWIVNSNKDIIEAFLKDKNDLIV